MPVVRGLEWRFYLLLWEDRIRRQLIRTLRKLDFCTTGSEC